QVNGNKLRPAKTEHIKGAAGSKRSNKAKAVLIKELMEGDRAAAAAAPQMEGETHEFTAEFRARMALFPEPPSAEMVNRLFGDVQEYIMARRPQGNQQAGERAAT
ncbi:Hypothetical predicted protein, partial [Pelobates cultripes]